jgi:hypothetical protein
MSHTADEVAQWMFKELRFAGILYQAEAVNYIKSNFGEAWGWTSSIKV